MSDEERSNKLIQRRGNSIVINKKWCLYGLAILLFGIGLGLFLLMPTLFNLRLSFKAIGGIFAGSLACLVIASFTND